MKSLCNSIKSFLNYKLIIVISSFFSVYKAYYLLDIKSNLLIYQISILVATFFVYNQSSILRLFINQNKLIMNKSIKLVVFVFSFIFFLSLAALLIKNYGIINFTFFTVLFSLAILYNFPIQINKYFTLLIRKIPYFKIFFIAFTWSFISSLIMFAQDFISILLFIQSFIFFIAITIPFDLRDREIDREHKLKTLAHLHNESQLINSSKVLLVINLLISVYIISDTEKTFFLISEIFLFCYLIILISLYKKLNKRKFYFEMLDLSIFLYGFSFIMINYFYKI